MYKLISLDLDGTLLDSNNHISDRNIQAIEACKNMGMITVVATGRPPRFTFKTISDDLTEGYCICYNGARIYHDRKLIKEECIEEDLIQSILRHMASFKVALECHDRLYSNFDMSHIWPGIKCSPISKLQDFHHVDKVLILNEKGINYDLFFDKYHEQCKVINTDGGRLIEVMAKGVSKCSAIDWIIEKMNLKMHEVIAFGDDHNDIEILSAVGLGVAMGNSNDLVKSCADLVTKSNDNDGVALVLERIVEEIYE